MADTKETTPAEQRMLYVTLGIVFLALAVTLAVTQQNVVMGLPFFVVGIVYFVLGMNATKSEKPAPETPEK